MGTLLGQHHVSIFTKDAVQNVDFYTNTMGLRLVKKSVNQDNPLMYHLFYGDATGSPGTELTFFELPAAAATRPGTNSISAIGLLLADDKSLLYWQKRFEDLQVAHEGITVSGGRPALPFTDPDGLKLVLIAAEEGDIPSLWKRWEKSTVPVEHQILGLGPIELTVSHPEKIEQTLVKLLGYRKMPAVEGMDIYQTAEGGASGEIAVKKLTAPQQKPGRGSVHHLAVRVADEAELREWIRAIESWPFATSGLVDRYYFQSVYFRESNGILFELATDGPGFTADEPVEALGEDLALPPFLESRRAEIEAALKPI